MSPIAVSKYVFTSAVFVISLFLSLLLLLSKKPRREKWRWVVKRYVYISETSFKLCTVLLGLSLLILAVVIAYNEIDKLIAA